MISYEEHLLLKKKKKKRIAFLFDKGNKEPPPLTLSPWGKKASFVFEGGEVSGTLTRKKREESSSFCLRKKGALLLSAGGGKKKNAVSTYIKTAALRL